MYICMYQKYIHKYKQTLINLYQIYGFLWVYQHVLHVRQHSNKPHIPRSQVLYHDDSDHPNWWWKMNESVVNVNLNSKKITKIIKIKDIKL